MPVIKSEELGPEFSIGEEINQKITVRVDGKTILRNPDGSFSVNVAEMRKLLPPGLTEAQVKAMIPVQLTPDQVRQMAPQLTAAQVKAMMPEDKHVKSAQLTSVFGSKVDVDLK